MSWFYNAVFFIFAVFSIPKFLVRLNQARNGKELFKQRFGIFSKYWAKQFQNKKVLWLHAVSVGEVNAAKNWLRLFLKEYSDWTVAFSTTTPTGQEIAQSFGSERVSVFYAPIDISFIVRRVIEAIHPKLIVLMETELWPNLISQAYQKDIPIGIINGRISPRSFSRYRFVRGWVAKLLRQLSFCLVQSERDESYFRSLGMEDKKLFLTGNLKFDLNGQKPADLNVPLGLLPDGVVFLAGSTHWNEEEILLRVFGRLRTDFRNLQLILAPRHPEQLSRVIEAVKRCSYQPKLFSEMENTPSEFFDVLIVDRMGVLASLYAFADLVFIGGSFVPRGGQNPFEAACFKKPILHGPQVFNFQEIYTKLAQCHASIQVSSEEELYQNSRELIEKSHFRAEMGLRAWKAIQSMKGVTERTINYLSRWIEMKDSSEALV